MIEVAHKPDFAADYRVIREQLQAGFMEAGHRLVQDNAAHVERRQRPDGSAQRANSAGVAKRKRKKYSHDVPLMAKLERFVTPARHRVEPLPGGRMGVVCRLPEDRIEILGYLSSPDWPGGPYEHWGIPPESKRYLLDRLKIAIRLAKAAIASRAGGGGR